MLDYDIIVENKHTIEEIFLLVKAHSSPFLIDGSMFIRLEGWTNYMDLLPRMLILLKGSLGME